MDFKISVIKGDGVGPEIIDEVIKVLNKSVDKTRSIWYYKDNKEREKQKRIRKILKEVPHREGNFKKSERRRYGPPR